MLSNPADEYDSSLRMNKRQSTQTQCVYSDCISVCESVQWGTEAEYNVKQSVSLWIYILKNNRCLCGYDIVL